MDDTQTISAVLSGDRERYADLIDRHKKMVYAIAWSHLGDCDLSEDAAQEAFVKAFCYLRTLRNPDRFGCWLATITRNVCKAFQRKVTRESAVLTRWAALEVTQPAPCDDLESQRIGLIESFSALSPTYREVLTVFYVEGKSGKEAAEVLGINEPALKVRLHRARIALRLQMERQLESALDGLQPTSRFTGSVMGLLPLVPGGFVSAAGIGGILGKLALSLSALLWMAAASILSITGVVWWLTKVESWNIKDTPENAFRKNDIWQTGRVMAALIAIFSVGLLVLLRCGIGPRPLFGFACVIMLLPIWEMARQLRVNKSAAAYTGLVGSSAAVAVCASLVITLPPPQTTVVVGCALIVLLFFIDKSTTRRHDENLFLRCATGGLREDESEIVPKRMLMTDLQMKAFARFLGENWLIWDYSLRGDTAVLKLSSARRFLGLNGGSQLEVMRSGECRARIGLIDHMLIDKLLGAPVDSKALEVRVCRVIGRSLAYFNQNELPAARSLLEAQREEEIFQRGAIARTERIRGVTLVVCIVFLLGLGLFLSTLAGKRHLHAPAAPAIIRPIGQPTP